MRKSSGNPQTLYQWKIISLIKSVNAKRVLTSEGERIEPGPFIPTIEETSEEERDTREYANTHQQDTTKQAHESGDQDMPQD